MTWVSKSISRAKELQLGFSIVVSIVLVGCSATHWSSSVTPDEGSIQKLLSNTRLSEREDHYFYHHQQLEMPQNVRPCCAFGNNQQVELGKMKIPFFQLSNTVGIDDIGPHIHNASQFTKRVDERKGKKSTENNGIVYTLRGGFIDLAHVRDTADNTFSLFYNIYQHLGEAFTIELPAELGERKITFSEVDLSHLSSQDRKFVSIQLAAYYAFKMAAGHEISQWHGYESVPMFSELVSAYSPEDLFSNMLGAKLAANLLVDDLARSSDDFNRHMTLWLDQALRYLGAVTKEQTALAFEAVDGLWWDSSARIPQKYLVLKRNYNVTPIQTPLVIDSHKMAEQNYALVANFVPLQLEPLTMSLPVSDYGVNFSLISRFTMKVDEKYRESFAHIPEQYYPNFELDSVNFRHIAQYDKAFDQQEYAEYVVEREAKQQAK